MRLIFAFFLILSAGAEEKKPPVPPPVHVPTGADRGEIGERDYWDCWGYLRRAEFFAHPEYGMPFPGVYKGKNGVYLPHPDHEWNTPEPISRPQFFFVPLPNDPPEAAGHELETEAIKGVKKAYNFWVNFPDGVLAKHGLFVSYDPPTFEKTGLFKHKWYEENDNLIFPGAPTIEAAKPEWNDEMKASLQKAISKHWQEYEEKQKKKIEFTKKLMKEALARPNPEAATTQAKSVVDRFKPIVKHCRGLLDEAERAKMDATADSLKTWYDALPK